MDYTASLRCVPSADLEAAGAWSPISNLKDPELQQLAGSVPDTLLRTVLRRNTSVLSGGGSFGQRRDTRFQALISCTRGSHYSLPATLERAVQSKSAIEEAVNAVASGSWAPRRASDGR